jgi:hypothetical protein
MTKRPLLALLPTFALLMVLFALMEGLGVYRGWWVIPNVWAQTVIPTSRPHQNFVDQAGVPCAGCSLYSYNAGTTTPTATFTDYTGGTSNPNPIILDAAGGASIWLGANSGNNYKFVLQEGGVTQWTVDQVPAATSGATYMPLGGGTFSGAVFTPQLNTVYTPQTAAQLAADVTAIGSSLATIQITSPITVTGSLTFPLNVFVDFKQGGQLTCNSPNTCLFNGWVVAPPATSIVGGTGTRQFLFGLYPEWVGQNNNVSGVQANLQSVGGQIWLRPGTTYQWGSNLFTLANVSLLGGGPASLDNQVTPTKFLQGTGTIMQGAVGFNASNITVQNLSIDDGSAYSGGSCQNALSITPSNIAATTNQDLDIENVSTLLCSPTSLFHSILIENANRVTERHIKTYFGIYGLVTKASNVDQEDIFSYEESTACNIIKSDALYGVSSNIHINGLKCVGAGGNEGPLYITSQAANLNNVQVSNFTSAGAGNAIQIEQDTSGLVSQIDLSNLNISSAAVCVVTFNSVSQLKINNLSCNSTSNTGVIISTGATGTLITNSSFTNVIGYGIDNSGAQTQVSNIQCINCSLGALYADAAFPVYGNSITSFAGGPPVVLGAGTYVTQVIAPFSVLNQAGSQVASIDNSGDISWNGTQTGAVTMHGSVGFAGTGITASGPILQLTKLPFALTSDTLSANATAFACTVNPTIAFYDCTTSSCGARTFVNQVTLTAAATPVTSTNSYAFPANDWMQIQVTAGTCTVLTLGGAVSY